MLAFGLNNSLKAENKSFDGQDIPLLFNMIDETISQMLPKLRLQNMIYTIYDILIRYHLLVISY